MKKTLILAASALILSTGVAHAGNHGGKGGLFENHDADGDGKISKSEFLDAHEQKFQDMDSDGDGYLSQDEAKAQREKMKDKWKERREKMQERRDERSGDSDSAE